MFIYSEQIDHQGHLIVFWGLFIQFCAAGDSHIAHKYTYNNDIRHEIFQLTPVFSTQKHCV